MLLSLRHTWRALIASCVVAVGQGQSCASTCPPLDTNNQPVPSLCVGDNAASVMTGMGSLSVCHPTNMPDVDLSQFYTGYDNIPNTPARILVIANHYTGCDGGRREANVYSYASTYINALYPNVVFLSSLKGGSSAQCVTWSLNYAQQGAINLGSLSAGDVAQPLTIDDSAYVLRDAFFTTPYNHPSYVIIDHLGVVRHKFTGPCCGVEKYADCSTNTALSLNVSLWQSVQELVTEVSAAYGGSADCFVSDWTEWSGCACPSANAAGTQSRTRTILQKAIGGGTCGVTSETNQCFCAAPVDCQVAAVWSEWSSCSVLCGSGERYRTLEVLVQPAFGGVPCPDLTEFEVCALAPCVQQCVPALGEELDIVVVASATDGLSNPRDVAFAPASTGQLGSNSISDPEAWVANGHDHSITILAGAGTPQQITVTRYDRGWYHYMINITALSFNMVGNSGRLANQDTFAYFATCQDNNNTYNGLKAANYFMGPSLYSSSPEYKNLVRHDGAPCDGADECFFLHADMLHESPSCPGIVHDPETVTAYGTVYWAIDGWRGHLVRYDFQQPHGAGLMDHSFAAVRRYPEVQIKRGPLGMHHGMAIDHSRRMLYVVSPGEGKVLWLDADSGSYARTAREEFPIYSSQLPSFEYSIYLCASQGVFATGLQMPSGLAVNSNELYVTEYASQRISIFDLTTGVQINSYSTGAHSLQGLAFAPTTGQLFSVDAEANLLLKLVPSVDCTNGVLAPITDLDYAPSGSNPASAPAACVVDPNGTIPDIGLFEQVHTNSGYADDNEAVQDDSMMDDSAAELANRTDCDNETLNFDAFLLGGFLCHYCLPDNCAARNGGTCQAIQWAGYTCDNEIHVTGSVTSLVVDEGEVVLESGRTYRFIVNSPGSPLYLAKGGVPWPSSDPMEVGTWLVDATAAGPDSIVNEQSGQSLVIAITAEISLAGGIASRSLWLRATRAPLLALIVLHLLRQVVQ